MATELGKAYVQIVPSARGISGSIQNAMGGEVDSAGKSLGSKLVGNLKKAIVAAGIGKMLADTIKEGARYEQARGGIETLFGAKGAKSVQEYAQMVGKSVSEVQGEYTRLKASETQMMKNANKAWKTAGLSANDYMEQSTSFAAALLQSVGGSQEKAAKAADKAVIAMSDNANKFGTNIQDIQNAYQGFAKQNYTMLDNLKLGYGGTKTEMERLLADAEEITGIHYDINNLSDVYDAISVIQDKLGVTGTTAKEAATTLSGSFASMKGALSNFMAQLVVGEDVKGAMSDLVESAVTFAGNLIPAIGRVFAALPGAIGTAVKAIHPELLNGLKTATAAVKKNLPGMIENALTGLMNFSGTIRKNAGQLVDAGLKLVKAIAQGIIKNIPTIIKTVPTIISNFAGIINDNAPKVIKAGLSILKSLAIGLIKAIPVLIANLPKILKAIWDVFTAFQWSNLGEKIMNLLKDGILSMGDVLKNVGDVIVSGIRMALINGWNAILNITSTVWNAIKNALTTVWDSITIAISTVLNTIKTVISTVFNAIKAFIIMEINGWKNIITTVWNAIKTVVTTIVSAIRTAITVRFNAIKNTISTIFNAIKTVASSAWNAIKTAISIPINAARSIVSSAVNAIKSTVSSVFNSIKSVASRAWNGVKSAITTPLNAAKNTVSNIVSKIKSFFPLNLGRILNISLPHISIGTTSKTIAGKTIKVPDFNVSWYGSGGVFDDPSLIGVGEAGREIVTPENLMRQIVNESNQMTQDILIRILRVVEFMANNDMTLEVNKREFGRMVREVQYG